MDLALKRLIKKEKNRGAVPVKLGGKEEEEYLYTVEQLSGRGMGKGSENNGTWVPFLGGGNEWSARDRKKEVSDVNS